MIGSGNSAPLYRLLEEDLFERIYRGEFRPGGLLPSEEELTRQYGVSRITVRRALDELIGRAVIRRRQGVGTFVMDSRETVRGIRMSASLDEILPFNRHEVVRRELVTAEAHVAEALDLAAGAEVDRVTALNIFDGTRFAFVRFHLPPDLGALLSDADFAGRTPPVRLIEMRSGLRIEGGRQIIEPVAAEAEIAGALEIEPGRPVLRLTRVYTARGRPMETISLTYHPDRYRITVDLAPMLDHPLLAEPAPSATAPAKKRRPDPAKEKSIGEH